MHFLKGVPDLVLLLNVDVDGFYLGLLPDFVRVREVFHLLVNVDPLRRGWLVIVALINRGSRSLGYSLVVFMVLREYFRATAQLVPDSSPVSPCFVPPEGHVLGVRYYYKIE